MENGTPEAVMLDIIGYAGDLMRILFVELMAETNISLNREPGASIPLLRYGGEVYFEQAASIM